MTSNVVPVYPHRRLIEWAVGGGLALAALGLYLLTLAPTVLEADGGEFQFVPWLPGIAHPTGYPFYILLGWLWSHLLPVGEVAWRMNLLSAVLAAVGVGITYAVARQMLDLTLPDTPPVTRILAASVSAAVMAVGPTFWSQALIAEVYALHALFVATLLWLVTYPASYRERKWDWLALVAGLGLTHHRTTVLLFPAMGVYLWFLWRANPTEITADRRPQTAEVFATPVIPSKPTAGWWLIKVGLLIAPLLLYLYLPIIAPYTPYATLTLSSKQSLTLYEQSFSGWVGHMMGSVFSDELKLEGLGPERLDLVWQLLQQQVGWVGVTLALAGLVTLWQRRQIGLLLLTGLGFLAFVAFNLIYFIGDIFVLFIPAWLFVSLWIGLGSLGLAHWLASSFVRSKTNHVNNSPALEAMERRLGRRVYRLIAVGLVGLSLFWPLILLVTHYSEVNQAGNTAARERWQRLLAEPIPTGAVLLSNDRNEIMPLWYYQYVEGRRPDLFGLFPLITPQPQYANVGRVLDQALASGRPVFLIKPMEGLNLKADLFPAGDLFQVTPHYAPPANRLSLTLPEITSSSVSGQPFTETVKLLGFDLWPARIKPGEQITVTLHWQTIQPLTVDYTSYVHLVGSDNQGLSQSDHRPGGDYYPSHLWQVDETLWDRHILTIPADLSPGPYRLRAGMYYQPEAGIIVGMGQGADLGLVTIE